MKTVIRECPWCGEITVHQVLRQVKSPRQNFKESVEVYSCLKHNSIQEKDNKYLRVVK